MNFQENINYRSHGVTIKCLLKIRHRVAISPLHVSQLPVSSDYNAELDDEHLLTEHQLTLLSRDPKSDKK